MTGLLSADHRFHKLNKVSAGMHGWDNKACTAILSVKFNFCCPMKLSLSLVCALKKAEYKQEA